MQTFKIATYNVNSVRMRIGIVTEWLAQHSPDVLCLQETKVEDRLFPEAEFRAAGYHAVFRGEKSYNGVALISKTAPANVTYGLGGTSPDESRLIAADVGEVYVVNTYVPQGRDRESEHFTYKLEWFARLRARLAKIVGSKKPVVWCGDLNVAPEDRDVHDPKRLRGHVCFCEPVTEAFSAVTGLGFVDVFRMHNPEDGKYTFFDYRVKDSVGRNLGWRIDHILATEGLAKKCRSSYVDLDPRKKDKPSDHTVLVAEFGL